MKITVQGLDKVQAKIAKMSDKAVMALEKKINKASLLLQQKIVAGLAAGTYGIQSRHGTAGLAGSVQVTPASVSSSGVDGGITAASGPSWYGIVHEMGGSREYTIVPQSAKALAWQAYGATKASLSQKSMSFTSDMVFAKVVHHPPLPQRRWVGQPVDEARGEISAIFHEPMQQELFEK
jgi:hypothetical protein